MYSMLLCCTTTMFCIVYYVHTTIRLGSVIMQKLYYTKYRNVHNVRRKIDSLKNFTVYKYNRRYCYNEGTILQYNMYSITHCFVYIYI